MNSSLKNQQNKVTSGKKKRSRFLSTKTIVQMANRLKIDLNKFGGLDYHNQERWGTDLLSDFIAISYEKRFGK